MLKALLCKLNIQHDWHVEHTEDGSLYKRCKRCGKDDDRGAGGTGAGGAWAGPAGMG
jgi:hypothetical protein